MDDLVTLTMSRNDLGQICDGLECRRDTWLITARYLRGEDIGHEMVEECSDPEEAEAIAATYERILRELYSRLHEQQ